MLPRVLVGLAGLVAFAVAEPATIGNMTEVMSDEEIEIACDSPNKPNPLRPNYLGIFYSLTEYRGDNLTFGFEDKKRCVNLEPPFIEPGKNNHPSRSIRIGCATKDHCTMFQHFNCKGSQRTYGKNKGNVKAHRGIKSIRCKQWHNPSSSGDS
ncbi:hypothetical protein GQ602_006556 [Ophiocordyceps camponoti-floridani]|uniref:Uncharacterized protein n=1 Tax=Ophiocordyceps camponoti-floridani TaxID=2030778 RepID=A0A8H4Q1F1_9HYPO|nr:hypothetical protein GQ602_006556 [Ophiocordyceps camponoti-floridani]